MMARKRVGRPDRLSLYPQSPQIALRRALSTPAPKSGPGAILCTACDGIIPSPKNLRIRDDKLYHRACPK
jgi:hypothetical protein